MTQSKVVVVEDEPEMLEIVKINLEQAGYEVFPAHDGLEGYELLEEKDPDALILDLGLPNLSGFRLLRLLRRDPRWSHLPVIVATAYAFEEVEDLANEGIDGFISKPFDPADLVSRLQFVLARGRRTAAG
ncbi:MAG TPA: response regulator transcription factor [Chloroflexota bacterium]|nr:response regulator transcription factor [Chloroflexota bacterium]HEX2988673.1 response regulator transcription factor [Chloroflexota bacterium]